MTWREVDRAGPASSHTALAAVTSDTPSAAPDTSPPHQHLLRLLLLSLPASPGSLPPRRSDRRLGSPHTFPDASSGELLSGQVGLVVYLLLTCRLVLPHGVQQGLVEIGSDDDRVFRGLTDEAMALELFGLPGPPHDAGEDGRVRTLHGEVDLLVVQLVEGPALLGGLWVTDQWREGESVSSLVGRKNCVFVDELHRGPDCDGWE